VAFRNGHANNTEHKVVPMSQSDDVSTHTTTTTTVLRLEHRAVPVDLA